MDAASKAMPDVVAQLAAEHTYLASLFAELGREHNAARARGLFRTLYEELCAHSAAEATVFYAALARTDAAGELVERARAAHEHIAALADELLASSPALPPWRELARDLQHAVAAHAAEEERELFSIARTILGSDALQAMGARLVDAAAAWRAAECGGWHPAHGVAGTDGVSAWF